MANTGFLSVSETSFDGIKQNLKDFLKAKTEFQDYNFEGSNLSALVDVLSYNSYMNAYYLNMIGSEMFLDTTQLKESAVSHANELNYLPRSRTSARALVTFTINTGGATPDSLVIPENYVVRAVVDQKNIEFSTNQDLVVFNKNGVYSIGPVYVYEGKIVTEYFTVDGSTRYILQSENVDTNSIKVTVINSDTDSSNSVYSHAETLLGLDSTSKVYFLQGYRQNQYEIMFGDGISGKALTNGNIVKIKYRSTNGELGNKVSNFSTTSKIEGLYNINVVTNTVAADGSEREDIDSIKFFAPRHFNTQNRAVTKEDYINLIRERFPQIRTVGVYGGEDALPPQYGKVIITPIPYGTIPFLSTQMKKSIINYLLTKTITTEPLIYDPEYLYLRVVSVVSCNPNLTTKTSLQLRSEVVQKIKDYDSTYLTEFGNDFRKSKLISMIDEADPSIISNDTAIRMIYKIAPRKGRSTRTQFSYSNPLYRPIQIAYQPTEQETFKSNAFSYLKNGIVYNNCYLSDDGVGNIRIYYTVSNTKVVLETNIGTINYSTGDVIFDLNPYDYATTIDLYANPNSPDVTVNQSKFLRIDYNNISVVINPVAQ
jgi:hypothetical protein